MKKKDYKIKITFYLETGISGSKYSKTIIKENYSEFMIARQYVVHICY